MSDNTASTNNWDTVFALNVPQINAAIAAANAIPKDFSYTIDPEDDDEKTIVSGQFSSWSVAPKGQGNLLRLILPISNLAIVHHKKTYNYDAVEVEIQVELDYFDSEPIKNGTRKNLKVNTKTPVSVLHVHIPGKTTTPFFLISNGRTALNHWLNNNLHILEHIFATIDINDVIDTGDYFAWTKPTAVGYAYAEKDKAKDPLKTALLAVLCMTENRPVGKKINEASTNDLSAKGSAAFLIRRGLILEKFILPNLSKSIKGAKEGDFVIGEDNTAIDLKKGVTIPFSFQYDNKNYNGEITSFRIELFEDSLQIQTETKTEVSTGIVAHTKSTHHYQIYLKTLSNGTQTMAYKEVGAPSIDQWATKDGDITGVEIAIGLFGALVAVFTFIVTDGATAFIALAIVGLIFGVAAAVPEMVKAVNTDAAPDIAGLIGKINAPLVWTGGKTFVLTDISINNDLVFTGHYQ